jgi:prepilin-type N-terminal cleavage/methylation domain-containing protein
MIHRRSGFTLMELMLAIAIALIVMMMVLPSLRGQTAQQRLQETFNHFDDLVRKAQAHAVAEQKAYTLSWQPGAILLLQDDISRDNDSLNVDENGNSINPADDAAAGDATSLAGAVDTLTMGKDETYTLERSEALLPPDQTPAEWTFWRSGTCEPVLVHYAGPLGTWTAQYNPLTGHGEITDLRTR